MFECEFCNKTYPTIFSLKNHQNKTKKCLQIQGKLLDYTTKFNIEFEKLPKFTEENVKASLLTHITINSIKEGEERYIDDVFKGIKKFIIIIDQEKGEVIFKDEDGNASKSTTNEIVRICFKMIKEEQTKMVEEIIHQISNTNN